TSLIPSNGLAKHTGDPGSSNPQENGDDESSRISTWHQEFSDQSHNKADYDSSDHASPPIRARESTCQATPCPKRGLLFVEPKQKVPGPVSGRAASGNRAWHLLVPTSTGASFRLPKQNSSSWLSLRSSD